MNKFMSKTCWLGLLLVLIGTGAMAQSPSSACEQAWSDYNDFKRRTVMAPSEYPLTMQGAAVRAACGADALPAPARVDAPRVYVAPAQRVRPRPDAHPPTSDEHKPRDHAEPAQAHEPHDGAKPSEHPRSSERRKAPVPPAGATKVN